MVELFREMERSGGLTVRICEQCLVDPREFDRFLDVRSDPADRLSLFRTGPRKLLQDGSLGARSAEMIAGYADETANHGIPIHTEQELYHRIKAAHSRRMNVAVHAIGDLALQKVCDAVERVEREDPWPEHRHGVVHAQITTPELLRRMKELGLQAYIQPIFIDADMEIIAERVGGEHAKDCYNWKAMEELGLRVSGGSDCPVEPFNVLDNLRAAVTRQNPGRYQDLSAGAGPFGGTGGAPVHLRRGLGQRRRRLPRDPGIGQAGRPGRVGPGPVRDRACGIHQSKHSGDCAQRRDGIPGLSRCSTKNRW